MESGPRGHRTEAGRWPCGTANQGAPDAPRCQGAWLRGRAGGGEKERQAAGGAAKRRGGPRAAGLRALRAQRLGGRQLARGAVRGALRGGQLALGRGHLGRRRQHLRLRAALRRALRLRRGGGLHNCTGAARASRHPCALLPTPQAACGDSGEGTGARRGCAKHLSNTEQDHFAAAPARAPAASYPAPTASLPPSACQSPFAAPALAQLDWPDCSPELKGQSGRTARACRSATSAAASSMRSILLAGTVSALCEGRRGCHTPWKACACIEPTCWPRRAPLLRLCVARKQLLAQPPQLVRLLPHTRLVVLTDGSRSVAAISCL